MSLRTVADRGGPVVRTSGIPGSRLAAEGGRTVARADIWWAFNYEGDRTFVWAEASANLDAIVRQVEVERDQGPA